MLDLYTYWRSSASYRVRIALNLKGLEYNSFYINLASETGEQFENEYLKINPQGLVPSLRIKDNNFISQSLSIIEYLEEAYPFPTLMPHDPEARQMARGISQLIACDIHPLNNLRVLKYLKSNLGCNPDQVKSWYKHWVDSGFSALEEILLKNDFYFSCADYPTIADVFIVPQVYNAIRFDVDLDKYPKIHSLYNKCIANKAFVDAAPENQEDSF